MKIDLDLLCSFGTVAKKHKKNEVIFDADEVAPFYYQIIDGSVRMFNSNDEEKEFTQGLFCNGNSFGESPLAIDQPYPSKEIINQKPEFRIAAFLNTYKKKSEYCIEKVLIPYTRQEIANFTGLRVEAVW
jgi:hypothetical protein